MTCNNPKLDLVNMNAYIKFGEILSICSQHIEQKHNFGIIKGHNSVTKLQKQNSDINQGSYLCYKSLRKKTGNNPNQDIVNMKVYIKFGEILSICSQDIEPKRNFEINKGN